jgi:hypothetical protein
VIASPLQELELQLVVRRFQTRVQALEHAAAATSAATSATEAIRAARPSSTPSTALPPPPPAPPSPPAPPYAPPPKLSAATSCSGLEATAAVS